MFLSKGKNQSENQTAGKLFVCVCPPKIVSAINSPSVNGTRMDSMYHNSFEKLVMKLVPEKVVIILLLARRFTCATSEIIVLML